jgi:hypothetical protein
VRNEGWANTSVPCARMRSWGMPCATLTGGAGSPGLMYMLGERGAAASKTVLGQSQSAATAATAGWWSLCSGSIGLARPSKRVRCSGPCSKGWKQRLAGRPGVFTPGVARPRSARPGPRALQAWTPLQSAWHTSGRCVRRRGPGSIPVNAVLCMTTAPAAALTDLLIVQRSDLQPDKTSQTSRTPTCTDGLHPTRAWTRWRAWRMPSHSLSHTLSAAGLRAATGVSMNQHWRALRQVWAHES